LTTISISAFLGKERGNGNSHFSTRVSLSAGNLVLPRRVESRRTTNGRDFFADQPTANQQRELCFLQMVVTFAGLFI